MNTDDDADNRDRSSFHSVDITPELNRAHGSDRHLIWQRWYDNLICQLSSSRYRFMNYGYLDSSATEAGPGDRPDRNFTGLYQKTLGDLALQGKVVLDVSSGLGGGSLWVARTHKPDSLVGIDLSPQAVEHCQRWYRDQDNLEFIVGDCYAMPMADSSFDVVYNIESSHCYDDFDRFLGEVLRVLKPGGVFCWSDFQSRDSVEGFRASFDNAGFSSVEFEDITEGVIRSLEYVRDGVSDRSLDKDLFIWGQDLESLQDVIDEFCDWRSYHRCRALLDR